MKLQWWDKVTSDQIRALVAWLEELYPPDLFHGGPDRQAQIIAEIYIPILTEGEGEIPESLDFEGLCQRLGVNRFQISSTLAGYMQRMGGPWDSKDAAGYLHISKSRVRDLARQGQLRGEKLRNGQWVFCLRDLQDYLHSHGSQRAA